MPLIFELVIVQHVVKIFLDGLAYAQLNTRRRGFNLASIVMLMTKYGWDYIYKWDVICLEIIVVQ